MQNTNQNKKIKVGIIGATGYAGAELVRLLLSHPCAELTALGSVSYEGQKMEDVYPNLRGMCGITLAGENEVVAASEVVFASLPHGLSEPLAKKCEAQGKIFIDLGADFRLYDEADYNEWYKLPYNEKELHKKAVYSIPELYRKQAKGKKIIGNPGCYPTSVALGLAPLMKSGKADLKHIIIDSKSGVTGAGRNPSQTTHYPDCNEAFSPYKIASHRHTPEIEQTLSDLSGEAVRVTFVPHLLPVNRGILSTMYVDLTENMTLSELWELYRSFYAEERFVRVMQMGEIANIRNVRMSNYCDISLHMDVRTGRAIVVSAIDNMVKGAAGQAIQNMNLAMDLPEETGLSMVAPAF